MNKKYLSFFILGLFVFSMFGVGMVSAREWKNWQPVDGEGVAAFLQGVINVASPFTGFLFGEDRSTGENGFIALAAFLLTLLVVFGILNPLKLFGQAKENSWINFAVAFIVALVGVRFIPIEMLSNFTLGAEGLVGALFLVIPFFVVAALILKSPHDAVRKILWTVYGVVILGIFIQKWATKGWNVWNWIYVAILIICIALFFMDGTIQKFYRKAHNQRVVGAEVRMKIDELRKKLNTAEQTLADNISSGKDENHTGVERNKQDITNLRKAIAEMEGQSPS